MTDLEAQVARVELAVRELAERLTHAGANPAPALDMAGRLAVADILDDATPAKPEPDLASPFVRQIAPEMLAVLEANAKAAEPAPEPEAAGEPPEACPFCGSPAGVTTTTNSWVRCRFCNAEGPVRATIAEAVAAWNNRAQPAHARAQAAQAAELAELRALCAEAADVLGRTGPGSAQSEMLIRLDAAGEG